MLSFFWLWFWLWLFLFLFWSSLSTLLLLWYSSLWLSSSRLSLSWHKNSSLVFTRGLQSLLFWQPCAFIYFQNASTNLKFIIFAILGIWPKNLHRSWMQGWDRHRNPDIATYRLNLPRSRLSKNWRRTVKKNFSVECEDITMQCANYEELLKRHLEDCKNLSFDGADWKNCCACTYVWSQPRPQSFRLHIGSDYIGVGGV